MATVQTYKCPSCGAGLRFDIDKQLWLCDYCYSKYSLEELKSQKAESLAEETNEDNPSDVLNGGEYSNAEAKAFSCPSCGGGIVTDNNTTATFCPYCHNPAIISSRLEKQYRPVKIIPFKLKKDEVLKEMSKFCKRRPFLPKEFKNAIQQGEVSGLYVPYWLFSADLSGRLDGVGEVVTSWSDGKYHYTKTDSYRVHRSGQLDFSNLPADGSIKMDDRLMEGLEPFNSGDLKDFSMEYLSGHFAESYDVDSQSASQRAFQRMKSGVSKTLRSHVMGYTNFRTVRDEAWVLESSNMYVLYPVWLLSVPFKDKIRMFAMNGQTGKLTGLLPLSGPRFTAWLLSIFAGAGILTFILTYFFI